MEILEIYILIYKILRMILCNYYSVLVEIYIDINR